ncbi:uncharacterized protein ATNIH1004_002155 [Aspergillus tanneri]|uniref:Terpene synthase n=1 Tax=Aspergillus tanneri TaxID=1220188 RepID=A0A5M9MVS3_9EURO|nr:uncharacterized protein ATNIH1004_002155 [Aspergillus tanneri]KAA8649484.1 hypothetical protein ATNIH1004_002155 [Aspergillus tanneri]
MTCVSKEEYLSIIQSLIVSVSGLLPESIWDTVSASINESCDEIRHEIIQHFEGQPWVGIYQPVLEKFVRHCVDWVRAFFFPLRHSQRVALGIHGVYLLFIDDSVADSSKRRHMRRFLSLFGDGTNHPGDETPEVHMLFSFVEFSRTMAEVYGPYVKASFYRGTIDYIQSVVVGEHLVSIGSKTPVGATKFPWNHRRRDAAAETWTHVFFVSENDLGYIPEASYVEHDVVFYMCAVNDVCSYWKEQSGDEWNYVTAQAEAQNRSVRDMLWDTVNEIRLTVERLTRIDLSYPELQHRILMCLATLLVMSVCGSRYGLRNMLHAVGDDPQHVQKMFDLWSR